MYYITYERYKKLIKTIITCTAIIVAVQVISRWMLANYTMETAQSVTQSVTQSVQQVRVELKQVNQ